METPQVYAYINDICVIGHGSIGKGTLPLIKRHFRFDKITIIDPHPVELPETSENVVFSKLDSHNKILEIFWIKFSLERLASVLTSLLELLPQK